MILSEDVIYDILLRLPAKSVLNCKYVCKTWFSLISSLISDPRFVKLHLDRTIHTKESKFMFVIGDDPDDQCKFIASTISYEDTLYSSSFITSCSNNNNNWVAMDFQDDDVPIKLLGSCNGLICIMVQTSVDVADGLAQVQVKFLVIWNPTTKEYKTLPESQEYNIESVYSFGYDHKNDDYKLLKFDAFVTRSLNSPDCQVAEVYSLQSDSWRSIETITQDHMLKYIPFGSVSSGVLVNGIYHWLAEKKIGNQELIFSYFEDFIVSFDFCEERFKKMHLPIAFQDISTYYRSLCTVGVVEGCLCAVSCICYPFFELEIWVMQDYGVQESWTKRFVIRHDDLARQLRDLTVTWCFKDDKILFHDKVVFKKRESHDQMLFLYDPKLDTGTTIKIGSSPAMILGVENYIESLVSLNSGTYAGSCTDILCASRTQRTRLFH